MTISAIPYVIISLGVIGLVLIIAGYLIDAALNVDNEFMLDPSLPYSHERAVTLGYLVMAFKWMGIISIITAVLFLQMNANQESSGEI
jgi:hypothetical protein